MFSNFCKFFAATKRIFGHNSFWGFGRNNCSPLPPPVLFFLLELCHLCLSRSYAIMFSRICCPLVVDWNFSLVFVQFLVGKFSAFHGEKRPFLKRRHIKAVGLLRFRKMLSSTTSFRRRGDCFTLLSVLHVFTSVPALAAALDSGGGSIFKEVDGENSIDWFHYTLKMENFHPWAHCVNKISSFLR